MSISEGSGDAAGNASTYGWANVSGQVSGRIDPYNDSDWYATYLLAGVTYTFQLYGRDLDSYLVLRNGSGTQLQWTNRAGTGVAETLTFTPGSSGLYYLDAQSYWSSASNRGAYTLSLASNVSDDFSGSTTTTSVLQLGQARNGVLETASDADWHRVQLVAGKAYTFQCGGALAARAYLKLFDPDALATGSAGAGGFTFTAPRSGTYYLEVSGQSFTDTGAYALQVNEVPMATLDSKAFFEGAAATSTVTFVLKLSAASPVDVTLRVDSVDYTAVAGIDYQAVHRTITIPAGQTSVQLPVQVFGNTDFQSHRVFGLSLSSPVNAQVGGMAYGYINDDDAPSALKLPTDDQLGFQWYLHTVRADWAWQLATGKGVKVGVFDQGVDAGHADLKANTNLALGRNAATLSPGGTPHLAGDQHGTWVAGVIASARDGHGTVGVAYDAQIVPIYSSLTLNAQYLKEIANAFTYAKSLDVLNNSWGFGNLLAGGTNWAFLDNANDPAYAPAFAALKDLVSNGRNGLGTIVVQSAGNGYDYGDDTNLHNFQNSRYVITVGATDYYGRASTFSTTGASVLVSAPGGGGDRSFDSILSTDRVGSAGASSGDFAYVDGTSFSAPIVSGIVAMMLEANPRLGYRDVQQILAYTARQTDIDVGEWDSNGARNWNGGGLHYNALIHAAGFGQVDALAAVRLAASWQAPALTAANAKEISVSRAVNAAIPDDGGRGGVHSGINVTEAMVVERVDVAINIKHSFVGDLSILLSSPSGTTSFLLWRPSAGALSSYGSSQDDIHFTFDTVLDWGENAQGLWMLGVYDNQAGDVGTLIDWRMNIVGRAASADDTYVYTNEYPDIVAADPSRAVLRDDNGGSNTLNAAALGLDNRIDLSGRTASVLNGATLTIAPGTRVATAIGGDGDDTLIASDSGSTLRGMGGNDTLLGGAGSDRLEGGRGNDDLSGSTGLDFAVFDSTRGVALLKRLPGAAGHYTVTLPGNEVDELSDVERLQFSDLSLALDVSGNAGAVAKLIGAVFGPARLADEKFVGTWLARLDGGMSYAQAVAAAVNSSDFAALAGSHLNTSFVTQVYKNVVGVAPDAATRDSFVTMLTRGQYTQASLAMLACELDLNASNIHLAGLADTGLEYLPAGG